MPFIEYKAKTFHPKSLAHIKIANDICNEYMAEGYTLTLRQLYYQFVARGVIENTFRSYKNFGNIIDDARLAGLLDWDAIEDRLRNQIWQPHWNSQKEFLTETMRGFKYDYWKEQEYYVEVWVEKEALTGVIERAAFRYRCPYLSTKGYNSQSSAWRSGQNYFNMGKPVKIIHLGDHDPSGVDMSRDNRERLQMFAEGADVELIRIALNMDQVEQYNPPPNPAKLSDSRAKDYIWTHGESSWELDALDPKIIDKLIGEAIEKYIDKDAWEVVKKKEEASLARLKKVANDWWHDDF